MPSGQQPEREHALNKAERQARYRARREGQQLAPMVRYRRPADRRNRAQRRHDAVAGIVALQAEHAAWYDVLPDNLRDPASGIALQAIVELERDDFISIEPPRGSGPD